jgi:hypothetical protein
MLQVLFPLWEANFNAHLGPMITNLTKCVLVFYKKAKAKIDVDPKFKK